ncbi:MAG: tRNA (guanosine(46)-N7)-methyltransferase TrmB [Lachnospiraceae bacterium]|nr:tRNA (guanosine(46)-N7)-methyltransferase TrmB [Lachnospiraceae bacterium]
MRLRNIPGSEEALLRSAYVIDEPKEYKGKWNTVFENDHPIRLEIGMGKGRFIIEMAKRNPDINYIGIEMYSSVLVRAVQKLNGGRHVWEETEGALAENDPVQTEEEKLEVANLRLLRLDARELAEVFAPGEVDRIYLNFSDPWPKDRHAKRRLPGKEFLSVYDKVLAAEGTVEFKTDNRELFEFGLSQLPLVGWQAKVVTFDLHADPKLMEGNVMTEYEEKFSAKGNPICKYVICRE